MRQVSSYEYNLRYNPFAATYSIKKAALNFVLSCKLCPSVYLHVTKYGKLEAIGQSKVQLTQIIPFIRYVV